TYYESIFPDVESVPNLIRELRDNRLGPFAYDSGLSLNEATPEVTGEEPLVSEPILLNQIVRSGDYWQGTGDDPFLVWALPAPQHVAGVRIRYRQENAYG